MKYRFFYVFALLLLAAPVVTFIFAGRAEAQALGEVDLHLASERAEDNGSAVSERHLRLSLATGWRTVLNDDHALGYGVILRVERGFQNGSELAGYGVGAFVGWYYRAFSLRLDYIGFAEQKLNSFVETQFRQGSGFTLNARWLHWLETTEGHTRFGIGPSLAFGQMKYGRSRIGTLPETDAPRTTESLTPGLTALFLF